MSLQLLPLENFLRSSPRPNVDLYVVDSESPTYQSLPELPGALTRFVGDEKVHTSTGAWCCQVLQVEARRSQRVKGKPGNRPAQAPPGSSPCCQVNTLGSTLAVVCRVVPHSPPFPKLSTFLAPQTQLY